MQAKGDYRIFIGAFPAGEPAERIQRVREQYDAKTAAITPPHVTLWGTMWRTGVATAAGEAATNERLRELADSLQPFALNLGGIHTFGQRVVYLGVEETAALTHIRRRLLETFGLDKHVRGRDRFTPHLTLAMRLKKPTVHQMVASLKATDWHTQRFEVPIAHLHLMQRGPHDPAWRAIGAWSLTGTE